MEPNDTLSDVPPEAPAEAPAAPVRTRPRGRTALLIAAAALLGISGGTAIGYGIQAQRPPSPLPALSQTELAYPAKALPADKVPAPLPASQDHRVKTDGDLRKLIIDRPAGWSEDEDADWLDDGWMSVGVLARGYEVEDGMFEYFLESDIRRVAGAAWTKGEHREATITLTQFSSGTDTTAEDYAVGQRSYMADDDHAGNNGDLVKGSGEGRYYVYGADLEPGYEPFYRARAVVHRGDIMIEINLYDTRPISKKDIRTLVERQLERV
ncbi:MULTISPECIES: hypothetical protein [Streptomyces]|uniref:hypothetical protein n=1 Tax=Streptomyces TaxID=1883 RepID=UPI0004BDEB5C|nr:hypothetical protein [Streptomyces pratensis]WKV78822.1 hypothetical protein HBB06_11965 [Streptomyces sp. SNU607]